MRICPIMYIVLCIHINYICFKSISIITKQGYVYLYMNFVLQSTLKQARRKTVVFPGFTLTLLPTDTAPVSPPGSSDDTISCATLLRDVGLPQNWCTHATHLEVVHILDTSTLPLCWVSPVHCTLYPPPLLQYNVMLHCA